MALALAGSFRWRSLAYSRRLGRQETCGEKERGGSREKYQRRQEAQRVLAGEPRRAWSQEPGKAKHRRPADIPRDPHHISCTFPAFERPAPGALSVPQTPSPITSFRGAWPRTHTAYTRSFLVRRAAQAFCSVSRDRIRLGCDGACPADAGKQTRARPTNLSLEQCARRSPRPDGLTSLIVSPRQSCQLVGRRRSSRSTSG